MTTNSAVSVNPFAAAMLSAAACLALDDPARAATLVEPDVTVLYALVPDQLGGSFGFVVETIGDPGGDGVTEFIVGQSNINAVGLRSGQAHIFSDADGSPLHSIVGLPLEFFGTSVTGLGDVTGDGVPDYAASGRDGGVMRTCTGTGENERLGFDALPLGGDPDNDWVTDPDWQAFLDPWLERLARVAANP